ncbi:MAG: ribbon-helix-helix domain-containing protein [Promethearchaeota archaeon]
MHLVSVKLPKAYVRGLDTLVDRGTYPTRSEAIRVAIRDLLKRELWISGSPLTMPQSSDD